jgi:hypothetical protein
VLNVKPAFLLVMYWGKASFGDIYSDQAMMQLQEVKTRDGRR